jgi:small subunit ribosomal protein S15
VNEWTQGVHAVRRQFCHSISWHVNVLHSLCRRHEVDTGSEEVQVAQLSARVRLLTTHLQQNRKDKSSQRGLQIILVTRKRLLKYLYRTNKQAFARCVRELQIRNPLASVEFKKEEVAALSGDEGSSEDDVGEVASAEVDEEETEEANDSAASPASAPSV